MINLRTLDASQPNQLTTTCHSVSDIRFSNRVVGNMGADLDYGDQNEHGVETLSATESDNQVQNGPPSDV